MLHPIVLVSFVAAYATAQTNPTNFSTCCDVAPNTVDPNMRLAWCRAQTNTCPLLCSNGQVSANSCNSTDLTYSCTCASGTTPNISDYGQTLPSLECDQWKAACVNNSANDLAGQNFCLSFNCGSKNASAGMGSSSPGHFSTTGSPSPSQTGGSSSPSPSTSHAAAALAAASEYGNGFVAAGLIALFGFAL